jgi:hypothetical protein
MTTTQLASTCLVCLVAGCAGFAATGDPMAPDPAASTSAAAAPPAAEPAPAVAVGQPVLARFRNGPFWFVGRAKAVTGDTVAVAYLDGSDELLPAAAVRRFDWGVGTRVECNWKLRGSYYAGRIAAVNGQTGALVAYDDGDKEVIDIAYCRSR